MKQKHQQHYLSHCSKRSVIYAITDRFFCCTCCGSSRSNTSSSRRRTKRLLEQQALYKFNSTCRGDNVIKRSMLCCYDRYWSIIVFLSCCVMIVIVGLISITDQFVVRLGEIPVDKSNVNIPIQPTSRLNNTNQATTDNYDTNQHQQHRRSIELEWVPDFVTIYSDTYSENKTTKTTATTTDASPPPLLRTCLVSAYFYLQKSKYNSNEYIQNWIPNFLSLRDECMIIFCEESTIEVLRTKRIRQLSTIPTTENSKIFPSTITTFYIVMKLTDLPMSQYYNNNKYYCNNKYDGINNIDETTRMIQSIGKLMIPPVLSGTKISHDDDDVDRHRSKQFWSNQFDIDPERNIHSTYELYWIWLSKSWFVGIAGSIITNYNNDILRNSSSAEGIPHHHHNQQQQTSHKTNNDNLVLMWIDIGMFRKLIPRYNHNVLIQHREIIPIIVDNTTTTGTNNVLSSTIVWMAHRPPNPSTNVYFTDKLNMKQHFYHSGSSAIGYYTPTWKTFHTKFITTFHSFVTRNNNLNDNPYKKNSNNINNNTSNSTSRYGLSSSISSSPSLFVGEDQCILQATCLLYPNLCSYIDSTYVPDNHYFGLRYVVLYGNQSTTTSATNIRRKQRKLYNTESGYLPLYWQPPPPRPPLPNET